MIFAHQHVPGIVHWFGMYHFIFLHLPIAAALFAVLAELLHIWRKNPNYAFTARFLLWMAFLSAIPTVTAGLMLVEGHPIHFGETLWMHRFFGIGTLILSGLTLIFSYTSLKKLYLLCLIALLIFVSLTGELGGAMSFPKFHWLPD